MSDDRDLVWAHQPDPGARRRVRSQVRFAGLAVSVLFVVLGWTLFDIAGGLAGVAVMLFVTVTVESWARGGPDERAHVLWVDHLDVLCADGPELYVHDGEGFEHIAEPPEQIIDLADVSWASVYPSTTDGEPGGREFHLVVDLSHRDGGRRCLVLDRRIPFRIGGELGLALGVHELVGDRWRDPDDVPDTFGELDGRRLTDWAAAGPG